MLCFKCFAVCDDGFSDNRETGAPLMQVFEVDAARSQPDGFSLQVEPPRATDLSRRICALLADLRAGRANHASCFVVRQGELPLNLPCPITGK